MSDERSVLRAEPRSDAFPVILAGPSGAGKTTIRDRLLTGPGRRRFVFSVSMTTRAPRPGETEAVDYRFVDREAFRALVEHGGMLEEATVHGELYGTPRENLEAARAAGSHLLLDIDVQGARLVRAALPDVLSIFVLPPTGRRIMEQLRKRGSESRAQLARRLSGARSELAAASEFDYVVVNDMLDEAVRRVRSVIDAEEIATPRSREALSRFVEGIVEELDRA